MPLTVDTSGRLPSTQYWGWDGISAGSEISSSVLQLHLEMMPRQQRERQVELRITRGN